jgi:hypothetical protein
MAVSTVARPAITEGTKIGAGGSTTTAQYYGGPIRTSEKDGYIWNAAPIETAEQGESVCIAPDFACLSAYAAGMAAARTAGAVGTIHMTGRCPLAHLHLVDTDVDAGETIGISAGEMAMVNNDNALDIMTLIFSGGLAASAMPTLPFLPVAGSVIRFGIQFKVDDADTCSIILGITDHDTTPIAAAGTGIFLRKLTTDTQPDLVLEKATAETATAMLQADGSTAAAVADDTWHEAGFVVNGVTSVTGYFDGAATAASAVTNMPAVAMTVCLALGQSSAAVSTLTVRRLCCTQTLVAAT